MQTLIHEHSTVVLGPGGKTYLPRTVGEERADGTWEGWIEFRPVENDCRLLRTDRETTQPNREALAYWASGLEPIYFEGAFGRTTATGA